MDFSLSSFNDGRNFTPDQILTKLDNDTSKYMSEYPSGAPIMIYNSATNQNIVGSGNSVLGIMHSMTIPYVKKMLGHLFKDGITLLFLHIHGQQEKMM